MAAASSNTSLIGTQQQHSHQLVHHDAANAATKNMTQDANLKIICKTASSTNQKQHAVGCEYIYLVVTSLQLTGCHTAGLRRELRDQFIAACKGKPPWSTKALVSTVREIQPHDVVSSRIFAENFPEKLPRMGPNEILITLEDATEAYMFEVIAASHCLK